MLLTFVLDVHPSMGSPLEKPPNMCGEGLTQSSGGRLSGWSMLDSAKSIVEQFVHQRGMQLRMLAPNREQQDCCMLVTTDHGSNGIKCGYAAISGAFGSALKTVVPKNDASECTSIGAGIGAALRLMNRHRLETDVDHFGRGRLPWATDFGAIIILTNGCRGSTACCSVPPDASSMLLAELCSVPYRWDQRVYAVMTELGTNPSQSLDSLCTSTGGMVVCSEPGPQATQCLETMMYHLQHAQPIVSLVDATTKREEQAESQAVGVGGNSNLERNEKMAAALSSSSVGWATGKDIGDVKSFKVAEEQPIRATLTLRGNLGYWPIPEPFWIDYNTDTLPPRPTAQPEVFYSRMPMDIHALNAVIDLVDRFDIPADWYELGWCKGPTRGGALQMDGRNTRWPVFMVDSNRKGGLGEPFGYIRASPVAGHVILVILPFNFQHLLHLLQQACERFQGFPNEPGLAVTSGGLSGGGSGGSTHPSTVQLNCLSQGWKHDMSKYISDTPSYYIPLLHRYLQKFGLQGFVQSYEMGDGLSQKIVNRLSRLRDLYAQENDSLEGLYDCSTNGSTGSSRRMIQQQGFTGPGGRLANDAAVMHEGGGFNGFKSAAEIPVSQLMQVWEKMRETLFGAGGVAVQGLFSRDGTPTTVRGFNDNEIESRRNSVRGSQNEQQHSEPEGGMDVGQIDTPRKESTKALIHDSIRIGLEPFPLHTRNSSHVHGEDTNSLRRTAEVSCSDTLAPNKPIVEMSNYMRVLMEINLPRNPWHQPEPDEDIPQGIFLRKLQVNFGNPFRGPGTTTRSNSGGGHGVGGGNSSITASAVGGAVDMILDDLTPSPMLDEVTDQAALLQSPLSPKMENKNMSSAVEELQMDQEDEPVSSLWSSRVFGDLATPLPPDSRMPPPPQQQPSSADSGDNNNGHVLPKLVHRKRNRITPSSQGGKVKWRRGAAPSTPPTLSSLISESQVALPTTTATEIDNSTFASTDSCSASFTLNNELPQILPSIEPMEDSVLLDFSPPQEEPSSSSSRGEKFSLEESAADVECNTPPPSVSSQEPAAQRPSEESRKKERASMACGIEGIQPMVVDAVGEGVAATMNDTKCGTGSSTAAAAGSGFENNKRQHSQLSPPKSQPTPSVSPQVSQPQVMIIRICHFHLCWIGWIMMQEREARRNRVLHTCLVSSTTTTTYLFVCTVQLE